MEFVIFHDYHHPKNQILIKCDRIVSYSEVIDTDNPTKVFGIISVDNGSTYEVSESIIDFTHIVEYRDYSIAPLQSNGYIQFRYNPELQGLPIGTIMRSIIDSTKISYTKIAESMGIDPSTLSRYLNGKRIPSDRTLTKFATVTGVPVDYLKSCNM